MKKVCSHLKEFDLNKSVFKESFLKEIGIVTLINFLDPGAGLTV